ncbi:MAG: S8 family serine peptidase [Longimicrobiales bacterium]
MGQVKPLDNGVPKPVHRDLEGEHIEELQPPTNPSKSGHGAEVVGLITALCDAPIQYYNVWTEEGLSMSAFKAALAQVAQSSASIVNLAIGIEEDFNPQDRQDITQAIEQLIAARKFVVAAVGETGKPQAAFPASITGVVAVGAVNAHDRPIKFSNGGAKIAAPGESIKVLQDEDGYRLQDGSSYAAASVSAAIWLALLNESTANQARMLQLLTESARPPKGPNSAKVGLGQIDLEMLANHF